MPAKRTTARQPRYWLQPPETAVTGTAVQTVVLTGAKHQATLGRVVSAPLRATMQDVASLTLTVADPDRELLGPMLDRDEDLLLDDNIDTEIGGIWWRLQGVSPTDQGWEIPLEDRAGAWLRRHDKRIKVSRGRVNRAQFVRRLYQEAGGGIPLYVPELNDKQRIAKGERPTSTAKRSTKTTAAETKAAGGWPASEKPTVKGKTANAVQLRTIVAILEQCRVDGASRRVSMAALMCATQESEMGVLTTSVSGQHHGAFHQSSAWAPAVELKNPAIGCHLFLTANKGPGVWGWKHFNGSLRNAAGDLGQKIDQIQIAGTPGAYAAHEPEAARTYDLWAKAGGGTGVAASEDVTTAGKAKAYVFERGQDGQHENSIECLTRLADEVGWNHWVYGGCGVFASDAELVTAPVGLVIRRDDQATVSGPRWKVDARHSARDMTVELLVDRLPEPGQVAMVEDEGTASGRWLVDSIECDLAQPVDTATGGLALRVVVGLARAGGTRAEPAHEYSSAESDPDEKSDGPLKRTGNKVTGGTVRDRIVFAAKEAARLDKAGQRKSFYSQSGAYTVSKGITGESPGQRSDCSQWVAAMYWSAGAKDPNGQGFNGGYTGTLYQNADRVSKPLPGDLCMYGAPPGHHVEICIGDGKTIGHGSPPVDYATPRGIPGFYGYYRPRVLKGKS